MCQDCQGKAQYLVIMFIFGYKIVLETINTCDVSNGISSCPNAPQLYNSFPSLSNFVKPLQSADPIVRVFFSKVH